MRLTLAQKSHLADNVWRFSFEPEQPVGWLAGQFIRLELPHTRPDAGGTLRWFTISGAPHEARVTITTRISGSTFKQTLAGLETGDSAVLAAEPAGDFTWQETAGGHHVFAAQGIGITPFYAIIKDRAHHGKPLDSTLIYAHQPGSALIYEDELNRIAARDPSLKIIPLEGTLTPDHILQHVPDLGSKFVYVSGPKSFLKLCLPPHNLPISQLKQDNFPGYGASRY